MVWGYKDPAQWSIAMQADIIRLNKLKDLAKEDSSTKRRELLREITDVFFETDIANDPQANDHFEDIVCSITRQMDAEIRKEIANRYSTSPKAPKKLVQELAADDFYVAEPVLQHSPVLQDTDLNAIIERNGEDHMRAISKRDSLSPAVTGPLIARGDAQTLTQLTTNTGAQFSREGMEMLVAKAETQKELHAPLVRRQDVPPDLLNEMYFYVEEKLRSSIMERNKNLSEEELSRALQAARSRLDNPAKNNKPADFEEAERYIAAKKLRKQIDGPLLVRLLHEHKPTHFSLAFSELAGVDFQTAEKIRQNNNIEAMAIICKAIDLPRDLFATLAVLNDKSSENDISSIRELGRVYTDIPRETAERTLRFWRMRKQMADKKAA